MRSQSRNCCTWSGRGSDGPGISAAQAGSRVAAGAVGRRRVAEVVATPVLSGACRIRGVIAAGAEEPSHRDRDAVTAQLREATEALYALDGEFWGGGGVQDRR